MMNEFYSPFQYIVIEPLNSIDKRFQGVYPPFYTPFPSINGEKKTTPNWSGCLYYSGLSA